MDSAKHQGAFFFGLIIGAIAGALVALLMTPKSGSQLRHELKDQAGGIQQLFSDVNSTARDRTEGIVGTYVDKVSRMAQRSGERDTQVGETTKPSEPEAADAGAAAEAVAENTEETKTE